MINVVCAIIIKENKILVTQRSEKMKLPLKWEFPGGKIESGESHTQALQREIKEEMEVSISVDEFFMTVDYDYTSFHLTMHCYICTLKNRNVVLNDHKQIVWVTLDNIKNYNWLPADRNVVEKLTNFQIN